MVLPIQLKQQENFHEFTKPGVTPQFPGAKKLLKPVIHHCMWCDRETLKTNGSSRTKAEAGYLPFYNFTLPVKATALRDAGAPSPTHHSQAFPFGNRVFSTDQNYHTSLQQIFIRSQVCNISIKKCINLQSVV